MVCKQTKLIITDNSGAKIIRIFHFVNYKGTGSKSQVGDLILGSVIKHRANKKVAKKQLCKVLLVTTKKNCLRRNGNLVRFDENRGVVVTDAIQLLGTRVFGPVAKDVKRVKSTRLLSLVTKII